MTTNYHQIRVGELMVDVVRKDIKNLHLAVYPPMGRVRVAAPLLVNDEAVRLAVISRLPWIKKQKSKLTNQARQSEREYLSGESHFFQGRRYRLNVIVHCGKSHVDILNKSTMQLFVREDSNKIFRERIVFSWYQQQLKKLIPPIISRWEKVIGVSVADWRVRKMKTKWGSCNIAAKRVWINVELAKKSPQCLEYVVLHEMLHLLERQHNERFTGLMNKFMPQWKLLREELNHSSLGHEVWRY